jgi:hypothetical protein
VALPKREFMEHARALWERLGLPPLQPEVPWHGYDLGVWPKNLERQAEMAARSEYFALDDQLKRGRRSDVANERSGAAPCRSRLTDDISCVCVTSRPIRALVALGATLVVALLAAVRFPPPACKKATTRVAPAATAPRNDATMNL